MGPYAVTEYTVKEFYFGFYGRVCSFFNAPYSRWKSTLLFPKLHS